MTSFTKISTLILITSMILAAMINNVDAECYMNCAAKHWDCFKMCSYALCVKCRNSQWNCFENCAGQAEKRSSEYFDEDTKNSRENEDIDKIEISPKFRRY